jgi:hypothetical protein
MSVSEEQLSAFADGMLEGEERVRIAALVEADPALSARVARMREASLTLRSAFDGVLEEAPPERFAAVFAPASAQVIQFPSSPKPAGMSLSPWLGAAAAACLAVAFIGGRLTAPQPSLQFLADGGVRAHGVLEHALDHQASGDDPDRAVEIALSFPADDGQFCRVFRLRGAAADATGLACGAGGDWSVVALSQTPGSAGQSGYQQAGGAAPESILHAAGERRAGDPLDADGEEAAIRAHWRVR